MDKHIHIDSIRRNLGITLKDVSNYNNANRDEIENIETIFNLQGADKEKVLALLYLLASGENNDVIQSYRNQTGLQEILYDSITKYNRMLVTALIYVPAFYTMAVNYYGAVSIGLPVGAFEEESALKDNQDSFKHKKLRIYPDLRHRMRKLHQRVFESNSYRSNSDEMTDELRERITKKYTDAFNANPNDYDTCMELVDIQIEYDAKKAKYYSTKALDIREGDPVALYARGLAYYKMGHNQEAMDDLQAVLKMDIQNKEAAYYVIGKIYRKKNEPEKAREAFEKCKAIDPDFADFSEILKEFV
jgi:tetratricopeptide (TPR) repeat protein